LSVDGSLLVWECVLGAASRGVANSNLDAPLLPQLTINHRTPSASAVPHAPSSVALADPAEAAAMLLAEFNVPRLFLEAAPVRPSRALADVLEGVVGASDAGLSQLSARAQAIVEAERAARERELEEAAVVSALTLGDSTGLLYRRAFQRMVSPHLNRSMFEAAGNVNTHTPVDEASGFNVLHSMTSLSFRHAELALKQRTSVQHDSVQKKQPPKPRVVYRNPVAPAKKPIASTPTPKKEPLQEQQKWSTIRRSTERSVTERTVVPKARNPPKATPKIDTGHIVLLELKRLRALLGGGIDSFAETVFPVVELPDPLIQPPQEVPVRDSTPTPAAVQDKVFSSPPKALKFPTSPLNRLLPGGIEVTPKSPHKTSSTLEFDGPPISTPFGVGKLLRARADGFNIVEFSWGVGVLRNELI
jgi:hypothetical protein